MMQKISITALCEKVKMSRQNFYKGKKERQIYQVDKNVIQQMVFRERALQPRLGGKKLYHLLKPELDKIGIRIGRDRFFEVLKECGLLLSPLPKVPYTTNSQHNLPVFKNTFEKMELEYSNQAWVADITYIRTDEDFLYLSLITDAFSRKIVGYHIGETLESKESLKALEMALKDLRPGEHPVHHSDRGSQYCSHLYVNKLKSFGLDISMTEVLHCYENAQAERVNGILKQEYSLGCYFRTKQQARKAIEEGIFLYNTRRPHQMLRYEFPSVKHKEFRRSA